MTLEGWVELLCKQAPALRAAGVTHIEAEGYSAELASFVPPIPEGDDDGDEDENAQRFREPLDALNDPATYGGRVPTRYRPDS